jgi:hypothetical protein
MSDEFDPNLFDKQQLVEWLVHNLNDLLKHELMTFDKEVLVALFPHSGLPVSEQLHCHLHLEIFNQLDYAPRTHLKLVKDN